MYVVYFKQSDSKPGFKNFPLGSAQNNAKKKKQQINYEQFFFKTEHPQDTRM